MTDTATTDTAMTDTAMTDTATTDTATTDTATRTAPRFATRPRIAELSSVGAGDSGGANLPSTEDMTITGRVAPVEFGLVAFDLYRDIHKGIRTELFAVTADAGRLDPSDQDGRMALSCQVSSMIELLVGHAEHEDGAIQPVLEAELPVLAELVEKDHVWLEVRMEDLAEMAEDAIVAPQSELRPRLHQLYLELASFTSAYLRHQDMEERVIMPSLELAIGVPAVIGIHEAIIGSIPPEEMVRSLALMLPALNLDDRAEMLGGMQAGAPPEAFSGVWNLVGSVLDTADHTALARRLGLH
jgi:Hemerythrin HHE cation binding domain